MPCTNTCDANGENCGANYFCCRDPTDFCCKHPKCCKNSDTHCDADGNMIDLGPCDDDTESFCCEFPRCCEDEDECTDNAWEAAFDLFENYFDDDHDHDYNDYDDFDDFGVILLYFDIGVEY